MLIMKEPLLVRQQWYETSVRIVCGVIGREGLIMLQRVQDTKMMLYRKFTEIHNDSSVGHILRESGGTEISPLWSS